MSQDGDDKDDKAPAKADDKLAAAKADTAVKTDEKAEDKASEKPAAKADDKADAKADDKPAAKSEAKADEKPKAEDKPAAKTAEAKADEKPKAEDKPAAKADDKAAKGDDKTAKSEAKTATAKSEAKADEKPAVKADPAPPKKPAAAVEPAGKSDGVVRRRNEVPPTRKNEVVSVAKPGSKVVPVPVPISALVGFAVIVAGALWAYFTYDVGLSQPEREILIDPGPPAALEIYVRKVPIELSTTIISTLLAFAPMFAGLAVFATGLRDGKHAPADAKIDVPITVQTGLIALVFGGLLMFLGHESGLLAGIGGGYILAALPIAVGTGLFCHGLRNLRRVEKPPPDPTEPPVRQSYHDMMNPVMTYPDGRFSAVLRSADNGLGRAEQVVLVTLLGLVMLIAASHALADKIANWQPYGHFKDDAIRGGTFAIALLGGAFATHQARHLAMDLITRGLPPRGRLVLKVVIAMFTIAMIVLLVRSGFHSIWKEYEFNQEAKLITPVRVAYLIPIGGALVILHTIIHTLIDIDYLARGKTPPERARSGH